MTGKLQHFLKLLETLVVEYKRQATVSMRFVGLNKSQRYKPVDIKTQSKKSESLELYLKEGFSKKHQTLVA